jgi:acetoin utilization deacetylase AcuC-like enzyme
LEKYPGVPGGIRAVSAIQKTMDRIPVFYDSAQSVVESLPSPSATKPRYVRDVLSLRTSNGFGTVSEAVAESLRWTSGSFVAAAMHAWRSGRIACSPTSGFHHAKYASGGGFCTFNGLMLAAEHPRSLCTGKRLT